MPQSRDPSRFPSWISRLILSCCVIFPSIGVVERFFGYAGVIAYVAIAALLLASMRTYIDRAGAMFAETQARWLAATTFAAVIAAFAILFPIADAGALGGGSDGDDALNLAAGELLGGRFPYYQRTYLNNLITPLPGAVMLAVPFVALGESGYQNLFWLAVLFLFVRIRRGSTSAALLLMWTLLALSPIVLRATVTGIDTVTNSIYVVVFTLLFVESVTADHTPAWRRALAAAALGVGFSSRANYILLLPVIVSAAVVAGGAKRGLAYSALSVLTLAAVTLPFYAYDPAGFSPLRVQYAKVAQFNAIVPAAGFLVAAATATTALLVGVACLGRRIRPCMAVLGGGAVVQAVPALATFVLYAAGEHPFDFDWAGYGVSFMIPGVLALWRVCETD